jgi:hypothetical protein
MNGDKLTRRTGYASVFAVAAVAALLSYWHAVTVVGQHGEPGVYGHLYPATIDGLIVAASMVLLDAARHHVKAPVLAWILLVAGIAATLTANVLDGIAGGFWGSIIAAWPALAFMGAYEMIMVLVRAAASRDQDEEAKPELRLTPAEVGQLERELDAAPKPMPKLEALLAEKPPWEPGWEARHPEHVVAAEPAPEPSIPTMAAPVQPSFTPASEPVLGSVNVRSPLSRAERKMPVDERVTARLTGSFPAVTD